MPPPIQVLAIVSVASATLTPALPPAVEDSGKLYLARSVASLSKLGRLRMGGVIILENQRARGRRDVKVRRGAARERGFGATFSMSRAQRTFVSAWRPRVVVFLQDPPVTARQMENTFVGGLGDLDPLAGLVLA